jgi:GNAT superfamily N-acetyltransferase
MTAAIEEGYVVGCIGRVVQLHAEYYASHSGFGLPFEAKVARELAEFCAAFDRRRDGLWLARAAQIEGAIAIDGANASQDGAHLRWFITADTLRGQGVGKQLLQRALAFADRQGYRSVYLWTFAGLDAARHLYESHGFRLVQQSPGSTWGTAVQEQRFVRERP